MINENFFKSMTELFNQMEGLLFQFRSVARPKEITPIQYGILEYLYFNSNKCLGEISHCMYLSMPNASREIKKLTELKLIDKVNLENDKRTVSISLSEAGRELMDQAFGRIYEMANVLFKDMADEDQQIVASSIQMIISRMFGKTNNDAEFK